MHLNKLTPKKYLRNSKTRNMTETLTPKKAKTASTAKVAGEALPQFKVFLVGMMGSGKSFWADKLKKKLKVPAYDLDNLVEIMEERTIAEMFAEDGEDYFRKEEAKMLRLFKEKKSFILSTGGGTACHHDNMEWMNKNGVTIFLDEPVEVLAERLQQEKEHRPLIKNLSNDELKDFLAKKLEERKEYYNKATYKLDGSKLTDVSLAKLLKEHA
jgi:shikimate kinase